MYPREDTPLADRLRKIRNWVEGITHYRPEFLRGIEEVNRRPLLHPLSITDRLFTANLRLAPIADAESSEDDSWSEQEPVFILMLGEEEPMDESRWTCLQQMCPLLREKTTLMLNPDVTADDIEAAILHDLLNQ